MRFKSIKNRINAALISGIILSLFVFTACGSDESSGDGTDNPIYAPIDTSYAKTMSGGEAVNISGFNGTSIYAMLSFMPEDKRESDSAPTTSSDWTLTSASGKSLSLDGSAAVNHLFNRYNVNLSRKMIYSSGQTEMDLRMRERENKALSRKVPQFSKTTTRKSKVPGTISFGTTWTGVYLLTDVYPYYTTINTTCRYVSDHAYFFVDDRDITASDPEVSDTKMGVYGAAFDAIYDINHAKFGTENDVDSNGKVIVVFSREVTGGILGYFYSDDKFANDVTTNPVSNEGDIFYMTPDGTEYGISESTICATLAHEFQHMIYFDQHYNRGVTTSYAWLNEALSQAAEYYNSYLDNHEAWIKGFLDVGWMNLSLTHWTDQNYGYGAIFIRYLIDQYGDTAIKNMCSTDKIGVAAVESATGEDFNTIFYNFNLALAMSDTGDTTDPKYNFTLDLQTVQNTGRGGLLPYTTLLNAGSGFTGTVYPYSIVFLEGSGTFSSMTLSGNGVIGTAFGLNQ